MSCSGLVADTVGFPVCSKVTRPGPPLIVMRPKLSGPNKEMLYRWNCCVQANVATSVLLSCCMLVEPLIVHAWMRFNCCWRSCQLSVGVVIEVTAGAAGAVGWRNAVQPVI